MGKYIKIYNVTHFLMHKTSSSGHLIAMKLNFVWAEWKCSSFHFEAITMGFREQDLMILCRAMEEILNLI